MRKVVLITGADRPTGITTALALKDSGYLLIGITDSHIENAYFDRTYVCKHESERFAVIEKITQDLAINFNNALMLFSQDEWVIWASENRKKLSKRIQLVLPPEYVVKTAMDKTLFASWAERQGFCIPKTYSVACPEVLISAAKSFDSQPFIIKPLVRLPSWDKAFPTSKLFKFSSYDHFQQSDININKLLTLSPKILVQEWIDGDDDDVYFVLLSISLKGKVLSEFVGRKLIQWPRKSGSTAACLPYNSLELRSTAIAIAQEAGYSGLCSIEFKKDSNTGKYLVTEPTIGRNDYQSYVANICGDNLTKKLVDDCFKLNTTEQKHKHREMLWLDGMNFLRAVKNTKIKKSVILKIVFACLKGKVRRLPK